MAKVISVYDMLLALAEKLNRPVMYISFRAATDGLDEIKKAAPYLNDGNKYFDIVLNGSGFIVCDDKEELDHLYSSTVGDDGPTSINPYNGPAKIYALTSDGNENT